MTKKDYETIAKIIAQVQREFRGVEDGVNALRDVAVFLASDLERDNPRFDRERFLKACGVA